MRILHTSDWHLGRSFHGEGLLGAQAAYVDHLVETVVQQRVDARAGGRRRLRPCAAPGRRGGAGRRGLPPAGRLAGPRRGHQRQPRLGPAARVQRPAGRPGRGPPAHRRSTGSASRCCSERPARPVAVLRPPLPRPRRAAPAWDLPTRSHHAALGHAVRRVRADLAARPAGTRSVVAGARLRDRRRAERQRARHRGRRRLRRCRPSCSTTSTTSPSGHLHGRATLTEAVRYSGSPIAYSFSEARHCKGSLAGRPRGRWPRRRVDFVRGPGRPVRSPGWRARWRTCWSTRGTPPTRPPGCRRR